MAAREQGGRSAHRLLPFHGPRDWQSVAGYRCRRNKQVASALTPSVRLAGLFACARRDAPKGLSLLAHGCAEVGCGFQDCSRASITLRITMSFRMQARMATFLSFPLARRRLKYFFRMGLCWVAAPTRGI